MTFRTHSSTDPKVIHGPHFAGYQTTGQQGRVCAKGCLYPGSLKRQGRSQMNKSAQSPKHIPRRLRTRSFGLLSFPPPPPPPPVLNIVLEYTEHKIHHLQFSCSGVSDSLQPHELQHARPPCPSPTPGVHSDSRPSSQ